MKTTELQLVSFEQAKKLKELGFTWGTRSYYTPLGQLVEYEKNYHLPCFCGNDERGDDFSAPTVALALKWFCDVKKLQNSVNMRVEIKVFGNKTVWYGYIAKIDVDLLRTKHYKNYEEAEYALLDKLLEL